MSLHVLRDYKAGQSLIPQLRLYLPTRIQDLSAPHPDFLPQGTKGQHSYTFIF